MGICGLREYSVDGLRVQGVGVLRMGRLGGGGGPQKCWRRLEGVEMCGGHCRLGFGNHRTTIATAILFPDITNPKGPCIQTDILWP